jgi:serine/threonine protein kinase
MELHVPLRCACPTRNQTANGTRYLLTYMVNWDDHVPNIAERFNVSVRSILDANRFSKENSVLVPPTTILIPLLNEPSSSQTITRHQKPASNPKKSKRKLYVGLPVKKMSRDVPKEVNMLQKMKHFNLMKLEGVCKKYGCFYLLFEYMEFGSLREWLRGNISKDRKSWTKRIQIFVDVANGLHYLQNFTEPSYIHMDIISSNILLNSNMRAKIGNFRLARTAKREGTNAVTVHVVGTRGYMAPEYQRAGLVTPKADVYAFGVIMLEVITGIEAIIVQDEREVGLSAAINH